VTLKAGSVVLAAAVFAVAGGSLPTASDAAWWPWSKRQDRTEQPAPAPLPGPAPAPLPGPAPGADGIGVDVAQADLADRLNRAEARIRELTGQVQELDFRLRQIQQGLGIETSNAAPTGGVLTVPDHPAVGGTGGPAADLGNLVIDAPANQPIDLTAPGAAPVAAPAAKAQPRANTQVVSTGDPRSDYDRAYSSILSGDYELAEASFRNFLATYPGDDRAPDAQYWLGESLFARGQYSEAADAFLSGYKTYPKSGKAADTLLKLGLSLAGLGEREAACQTYAEVLKKYPDASNALHQRVTAEQAVANC
jgi:tol-pal system protein YbgF